MKKKIDEVIVGDEKRGKVGAARYDNNTVYSWADATTEHGSVQLTVEEMTKLARWYDAAAQTISSETEGGVDLHQ